MRAGLAARRSEFNKDRHVQPVLGLPQIRGEPWHQGAGRTANIIAENRGRAGGWRDTTRSREIRHIGRPMVVLPTEGNVLARHPVKSSRYVPSLIRIAGILGEVGRARSSSRAVDRRQQNQIPPGIVNLPAAQCQAILVVIEPEAVIENVYQKSLLVVLLFISVAHNSAPRFSFPLSRRRERAPIQGTALVLA